MKIKTQNIKQNLRSSTTYRLKDTQKRTFDVKFKKNELFSLKSGTRNGCPLSP